jgi:hypothetical protein
MRVREGFIEALLCRIARSFQTLDLLKPLEHIAIVLRLKVEYTVLSVVVTTIERHSTPR